MNIIFDDDIKTDYEGYMKLIQIISEADKSFDVNIVFDFRNVHFFEANLCAVLGAIIEIITVKGKTVSFINIEDKVKNIMRKNLFLFEYGFPVLIDSYNTSIEYQKFNPSKPEDDHRFNQYIQLQLLGKPEFPSHSALLGIHIARNIFELYENARTHWQMQLYTYMWAIFSKKAFQTIKCYYSR